MKVLSEIKVKKLVSGMGDYAKGTACIISAANAVWRFKHGMPIGQATDTIECVCSVIRAFCIRINDANFWVSDAQRTEVLSEYIEKILDTKASIGGTPHF